jgi:hypothetical protein
MPSIYKHHVLACGKSLANPNFDMTNFDNIFYSLVNVFQCVTLENWTDIMYKIFGAFTVFTVVYFVLLVFIGSFFLLNLTLAVIKVKFTDADVSISRTIRLVFGQEGQQADHRDRRERRGGHRQGRGGTEGII